MLGRREIYLIFIIIQIYARKNGLQKNVIHKGNHEANFRVRSSARTN